LDIKETTLRSSPHAESIVAMWLACSSVGHVSGCVNYNIN